MILNNAKNITIGNSNCCKAYMGNKLVWTSPLVGYVDEVSREGYITQRRYNNGSSKLFANPSAPIGVRFMDKLQSNANESSLYVCSNNADFEEKLCLFTGGTSFLSPNRTLNKQYITDLGGNIYISSLVTSKVTDMHEAFYNSNYNQPGINRWDVSNVTSMFNMFSGATYFNQPLDWHPQDTFKINNMEEMFIAATSFNQNISMWCVKNILTEPTDFSYLSNLSPENMPKWGAKCPCED